MTVRWHSIKKEGLPPIGRYVLVTLQFDDGTRYVEEMYKFQKDVAEWADITSAYGRDFIKTHENGIWVQWHSDGFDRYVCDVNELVVAWMPYPDPWDGDDE